MAVTNQELFDIFLANPNMSDAQIVSLMETRGISPEQVSSTFGLPVGDVISRAAATVAPGNTVTLGDTRIAPQYDIQGSGENQQIGGITNITVEKTTGDINYQAPVGSEFQNYSPTGEFTGTGVTQKANNLFKEFLLGSAALFGGAALAGFGPGAATGLTAAEIAALTAQDLAIGGGALAGTAPLTAAQIAGLTATDLAIGAGTPSAASTVGLLTPAATVGTTGLTAAEIASLTAQDLAIGGGALAGTPPATIPGLLTSAATTAATTLTPATTVASTIPAATAATASIPAATTAATLATTAATTGLTTAQVANLVQTGLTTAQIANLFSTGATTAAGLLQQQTSREAAQAALQMINAETAAAKQGAQFRPIGMTTRFGTSQFVTDPVTGRLTSAGYTLDPQAKNAQDRLVKLAEQGLVQAEGAQAQFAPLQTGAQRLFELGQGYLAKTPESVAQNYLNQQMALLQPGRETELATLQNRLQQQGRGGLSVAQGGTMGATTPELQALYNARAQQEAQLAANAQQFGQQQVQFGAGLLGQGASAMGQYYGGQQQAYSPFTTALGQVQGLEQLAQQPLQMGINLGQIGAQTGFDAGRLGLQGAGQATTLATGPAATNNPYASLLSGVAANPLFGQAAASLFSPTNEQLAINPYFQRTYG